MRSFSSLLVIAPAVALVFAQLGCGGQVDGVPSGSTSSPPGASAESPGDLPPAPGAATGASSTEPESCKLRCDEGHERVASASACASGAACYARTACGQTITCTGAIGLCDEPACLGYTTEVKSCRPGKSCETQQVCERTLICEKADGQCDGLPTCDEGDTQVESATECATHGARCYARAECGGRIYCVRAL